MSNFFFSVSSLSQIPTRDHDLLTGLIDDDHTQYALLAGRSGGQTLKGDTTSGGNLTFQSTAHATKGKILFGANSAYDEVNERLGIGTNAPANTLHIKQAGATLIIETTSTSSCEFDFKNSAGVVKGNFGYSPTNDFVFFGYGVIQHFSISSTGVLSILGGAAYLDVSAIDAGNPNLKITATSDTPTVAFTGGGNAPTTAPAGYLEILVGSTPRYIPFWA